MDELRKTGRVTIPTDLDVVPETLKILKKWGADAIRDCDGTDFPQQLKDADAKIYSSVSGTTSKSVGMVTRPDFLVSSIGILLYLSLILNPDRSHCRWPALPAAALRPLA